jgi:hypothetical protein
MKILSGALILLLAGAAVSNAQVTVQLDSTSVPVTACNQLWTDSGVDLRFVPTTAEDACPPGFCSFTVLQNNVAFIGRLEAVLTQVPGLITQVSVDVESFCSPGCTRAFLYENGTIIDSASVQTGGVYTTLVLDAGPNIVDEFAVSTCEGFVYSITVTLASGSTAAAELPASGALQVSSARPNPFDALTSVSFRTVEAAPVRVTVYDARGVRVRTLLERWLPAGSHEAAWDGRSDGGAPVPAGVYFYDVKAARDVHRGKVVHVR